MEVQNVSPSSREPLADTKVLFRNVFGCELFEDYIGELVLLSSPPPEFDPSLPPEIQKPKLDEIMKTVRDEREQKLIETLKNRLELFVDGKNDEFVKCANLEVQQLSQAEFGVPLLHAVGYIYTKKATKEMRNRKHHLKVLCLGEWLRYKGHKRNSRAAAASAAVSYIKQREVWKTCSKGESEDENALKRVKKAQDAMLKSFWKMNVADIEMTLSHVCQVVLKDPSASKNILHLRAKGMKKIGEIFLGAKAR